MITTKLAKELKMKIAPSNIFDIVLGYFTTTYTLYYTLPVDQAEAFDIIIANLKSAAEKYRAIHGRVPALFIDGADLIAKNEQDLFLRMLVHAKDLANEGDLTIVFISSEGSVIPLVQQISGVSRWMKFFKVVDVPDEAAVEYLVNNGLSKELSQMFVEYTGGRCIYLNSSKALHYFYRSLNPDITVKELYDKIIADLFSWKVARQLAVLKVNEPYNSKVIKTLVEEGEYIPGDILDRSPMANYFLMQYRIL